MSTLHAGKPGALDDACARLARCDQMLEARARALCSLDPERDKPTQLAVLGRTLLTSDDAPEFVAQCADAIATIAESQLRHFPDNLFWDLDYPLACVIASARAHGLSHLRRHAELFAELQRAFGCESVIRFRYVHDFIYGFDWQRFVMRDPQAHGAIGPFDAAFLERVLRRGGELRQSIERDDDPQYPALAPGQWRNPYAFSRTPEHEARLHRELARAGLIPVYSWRIDATPDWRRPYTQLRLQCARELGIPHS